MRRQGLKWIGAFAAPIVIFRGHRFQSGSALRLERLRCFDPLKRAIAAAPSYASDGHRLV